MDTPTLKDFLTAHPLLGNEGPGTHSYIRWRQIFWEHLLNRSRALAEDLTPLRTFEVGARLQGHLDDEPMTHTEFEAVQQLATALSAGDDFWQHSVLMYLGLDMEPEEGMTPFRRAVLVHVFRHGYYPIKQPWYRPDSDMGHKLADERYVDSSGKLLQLTDEGLAAAGVLRPQTSQVDPGTSFTSGSEAYGLILGPVDDAGTRTIVRLLEVQA